MLHNIIILLPQLLPITIFPLPKRFSFRPKQYI
jgi:hypothetical protein